MSSRDELARIYIDTLNRGHGMIERSEQGNRAADAILAAGYRKPRTLGFIVVDAETKQIDWDGDLHPSREAAIESMTGPRHMYCKSVDEENDDKTYWGRHYLIAPVEMPDPAA